MPLPPLPASNTPRLYIRYSSCGEGHTLDVHLNMTDTTVEAAARYNAVKTAFAALLPSTDSVQGADFSDAGSNIRFPLAVAAATGTNGFTSVRKYVPIYNSVTGRSINGRKVRLGIFSPVLSPEDEGSRVPNTNTAGALFWNLITGAGLAARSITGDLVVWNTYVNSGFHDHWVREIRSNP